MSRIFTSSLVAMAMFVVSALLLMQLLAGSATNAQTPSPPDPQCVNGCQPWNALMACTIGKEMRLPLVLDISRENAQNVFNGQKNQIGYGYCPQVDQLQAFSLPEAAGWAAGDFRNGNFTADTAAADDGSGSGSGSSTDAPAAYLRIFGAVGFQDTKTNIPKNTYSSSAVIFDPKQSCTTANNEDGFLVATFLVINFTMTNGEYRMISSFDQSVQVGFEPTCDSTDTCQISSSQPCLGNTTGNKNCAVCVARSGGVAALNNTQIQVFASYYGTDANGRKMQSGSSNPLNFLALSSTGVFNKLKSDITGAVNTVQSQIPGQ